MASIKEFIKSIVSSNNKINESNEIEGNIKSDGKNNSLKNKQFLIDCLLW